MKPTLYIFSGLPGTGKTTLARKLASHYRVTYFRLDTIEQGIRELCGGTIVGGEGYEFTGRLVSENLLLGISCIVDCCNPIEQTRNQWEQLAKKVNVNWINIEIICSDYAQHRFRIEHRTSDIAGFELPTWENVCLRQYDQWVAPVITIDTANQTVFESFDTLVLEIESINW